MAEWDLRFGGHAYEDHAVAHCGVDAGVAVAGGRVTVVGAALLRDRHGDDPWRGAVTVQVMFVG